MPDYSIQRLRGGFAIVFHDPDTGKRQRRQLVAQDRVGAEAEGRTVWAAAAAPKKTVGDVVKNYLDLREAEGMLTIRRRRDAWNAMKGFWDRVNPELIDEPMCRAYRLTRTTACDATVRLELALLSSALGRTFGREKKDVWLPAKSERRERHLTHEDFHRFLAEVRAPHARLYVMLGLFTLARPSALMELKWVQVNLDHGFIDLNPEGRTQTKKRRPVVPINGALRAELVAAHERRDCEYVISYGGERIASIKKAFQAASQRSTVHATPYTLRHTGAVWVAEQGVPMSELAQMLGHDDSATTEKHYARYSPTYLRRVADAVQVAFEVQTEPRTPVLAAA